MERNSSSPSGALFARVFRGAHVESWHRGSLVVVQDDKVVRSYGDPDLPIWCRSAVKPFQALPLLERGVAERLGFGDREIALLSASHEGSTLRCRARSSACSLMPIGSFTVRARVGAAR